LDTALSTLFAARAAGDSSIQTHAAIAGSFAMIQDAYTRMSMTPSQYLSRRITIGAILGRIPPVKIVCSGERTLLRRMNVDGNNSKR
jgi:hypothetical protein